jgi:predicted RNase H-like nuclease (RuvC/YqgF family)
MTTPIEDLNNSLNKVTVQLENQIKELKRLRMVEAKFKGVQDVNVRYRREIIAYKDVNERSQKLINEKDTEIDRLNKKLDHYSSENFKPVTA